MAIPPADLTRSWFQEFVYGMMMNDLNAAIDCKANFLAALGVMTYSEILGALARGTIGTDGGKTRDNFYEFVRHMPDSYMVQDGIMQAQFGSGLYQTVRNGLTHEYFIKKRAIIYRNEIDPSPCGIFWDPSKRKITVVLRRLVDDFRAAAHEVESAILQAPKPETLAFFARAVAPGP